MPAFAATTNIVQYNGGTIRSLNGEVFTFNCVMRNNVMSSLDRSHKQHIPARTVLLTVQLSLFSALPEMAALINSITLLLAAAQRHWLQRNSIQTLPHRATLKPSNQRKKKKQHYHQRGTVLLDYSLFNTGILYADYSQSQSSQTVHLMEMKAHIGTQKISNFNILLITLDGVL